MQAAMLDVTVSSPSLVDMEIFDFWIEGYSIKEVRCKLAATSCAKEFAMSARMLETHIRDHYAQFSVLEAGLRYPNTFVQACAYNQLSLSARKQMVQKFEVLKRSLSYITFGDLTYCAGQLMSHWSTLTKGVDLDLQFFQDLKECKLLIEKKEYLVRHKLYYSVEERLLRELVGRKLSNKTRRELSELAERCELRLPSCKRQFDNLVCVARRTEDLSGRLVDNIQALFLLPRWLSEFYAAVVFIITNRIPTVLTRFCLDMYLSSVYLHNATLLDAAFVFSLRLTFRDRFEVLKRSLSYITFGDLTYCAGQLMSHWSTLTKGVDLDLQFFQDLKECKLLIEKKEYLVRHKLYYSVEERLLRELVGRKLSNKTRRELSELAERCELRLPSCKRQFDNLVCVARRTEDLSGRLVDNIQALFLLPRWLSEFYAAVVFIITKNRLVTRALHETKDVRIVGMLDANFKPISKAVISIACGLSQAREMHDLFLDIVEKLIEPMRSLGWPADEVRLFFNAYGSSAALLPPAKLVHRTM
ncbi:hypothetical protein AHF37_05152 [Paragonimus kellicotti]|nr:hypothetical protein AHF37_05152 [Paragonimus kellicotti]